MNPLNLGINPLAAISSQERSGRWLDVSFTYDNLALIASNQYAIWIEDIEGNYIDTLYVTRYTAQEGNRRRPNSIPQWVAAANPLEMRHFEVDAISGATPRSGEYYASWDFTDSSGNAVTDTEVRLVIEASVMNDDTARYSGVITLGNEMWAESPTLVFSNPDSEYNAMLTDVWINYSPR
jgi:hypothetical protein